MVLYPLCALTIPSAAHDVPSYSSSAEVFAGVADRALYLAVAWCMLLKVILSESLRLKH